MDRDGPGLLEPKQIDIAEKAYVQYNIYKTTRVILNSYEYALIELVMRL